MIKVYDIGNDVKLDNNCTGKILAVNITGVAKYITYNITWWNEGTRHTAWLTECEFKSENKKTGSIGFR